MLSKHKHVRSNAIRKAANRQPCTMNSPVCNYDSSTTVLCHLNESFAGKGFGIKADDLAAFFGCSACHEWYDRRLYTDEDDIYFYLLRAVVRTARVLVDLEKVIVVGHELD